MNLLSETIESIKNAGHQTKDVLFVGSKNGKYRISWKKFTTISDFEYDDGYGAQAIATDLIVYFKDKSYLYREDEYDGAEGWFYMEILDYSMKDDTYSPFSSVGGDEYMWGSLEEINKKHISESNMNN